MEQESSVKPAATAVVGKTHSRKDGNIIDKRAESLIVAAEALAIERSQDSTVTEGSQVTPTPLQLTQASIVKETNSKGRIYGLGSIQYLDAHQSETGPASILKKAANSEEISNIKETIGGLKAGMTILLSMNGVDPLTYQPVVPRESALSAPPSPHSKSSKQPNQITDNTIP